MKESVEICLILASLLFYADFDSSFDAVYSKGNGQAVIEADRYKPRITGSGGGRFGEAAEFWYEDLVLETVWTKDVVRYPAKGNFPYTSKKAFDGTIKVFFTKKLGFAPCRFYKAFCHWEPKRVESYSLKEI